MLSISNISSQPRAVKILKRASIDVCVDRLGKKCPHTVASKISYGNFKMFYSFNTVGWVIGPKQIR